VSSHGWSADRRQADDAEPVDSVPTTASSMPPRQHKTRRARRPGATKSGADGHAAAFRHGGQAAGGEPLRLVCGVSWKVARQSAWLQRTVIGGTVPKSPVSVACMASSVGNRAWAA